MSGCTADAVVVGLCGERGREAQRWIERRDARTTVVCSTSDRPAKERIACVEVAFAHADALRDRGLHVAFVLDSLARFAAALRETATARGESVGRGGYPASVFAQLARFVEIAGPLRGGSITLIATVLSDGDDRDPVSDAARSLLDGHLQLSPRLAAAGRFPAIDVPASASRTMEARCRTGAAAQCRRGARRPGVARPDRRRSRPGHSPGRRGGRTDRRGGACAGGLFAPRRPAVGAGAHPGDAGGTCRYSGGTDMDIASDVLAVQNRIADITGAPAAAPIPAAAVPAQGVQAIGPDGLPVIDPSKIGFDAVRVARPSRDGRTRRPAAGRRRRDSVCGQPERSRDGAAGADRPARQRELGAVERRPEFDQSDHCERVGVQRQRDVGRRRAGLDAVDARHRGRTRRDELVRSRAKTSGAARATSKACSTASAAT